jgi:hypothetical protein
MDNRDPYGDRPARFDGDRSSDESARLRTRVRRRAERRDLVVVWGLAAALLAALTAALVLWATQVLSDDPRLRRRGAEAARAAPGAAEAMVGPCDPAIPRRRSAGSHVNLAYMLHRNGCGAAMGHQYACQQPRSHGVSYCVIGRNRCSAEDFRVVPLDEIATAIARCAGCLADRAVIGERIDSGEGRAIHYGGDGTIFFGH